MQSSLSASVDNEQANLVALKPKSNKRGGNYLLYNGFAYESGMFRLQRKGLGALPKKSIEL